MLGLANPGISSGLSFGRSRSQITFEKFCEKKIIAKKKYSTVGARWIFLVEVAANIPFATYKQCFNLFLYHCS